MQSLCIPQGDPVNPPNPLSQKIAKVLTVCMYAQIGVGVFRVITGDLMGGIFEGIACLILYGGYTRLNYCSLVIYIFLNMQQSITSFTMIGTAIQQNEKQDFTYLFGSLGFWLQLVFFVFYVVAIYWAFQGYKEFKALSSGGQSSGLLSGALGPSDQAANQSDNFPRPGGQAYQQAPRRGTPSTSC